MTKVTTLREPKAKAYVLTLSERMALARYEWARDKIEALGVDEILIDELEEAFIDLTLAEVAARPTIRAEVMRHLTNAELDAQWTKAIDANDEAAAAACEAEFVRHRAHRTRRQRPKTPLILDMEARLAARAGLPRCP